MLLNLVEKLRCLFSSKTLCILFQKNVFSNLPCFVIKSNKFHLFFQAVAFLPERVDEFIFHLSHLVKDILLCFDVLVETLDYLFELGFRTFSVLLSWTRWASIFVTEKGFLSACWWNAHLNNSIFWLTDQVLWLLNLEPTFSGLKVGII